jgi:hypothetical protein
MERWPIGLNSSGIYALSSAAKTNVRAPNGRFRSRNAVSIAVAEGASIWLGGRGVVTGAWGTTKRRQLALSSAELHHGATRAKGLRAPAQVVGRPVWLGKPRGIPAGAQIFHRKGPRARNGPSSDRVSDRHDEQRERRTTTVCRPKHRDPSLTECATLGAFVWLQKRILFVHLRFTGSVAAKPRTVAPQARHSPSRNH